jgi:glycosyltransferase involved in cell wall biosynthesis
LDAIVFPNVYSFVPVWGRAVKIQFVHDAIAHFWARTVFPDVGSRLRWQAKSWLARSRADKLVTVSEYSRRKLCEAHGFRPEEIALVGEAPDSIFQPLGNGRRPAGLPFDSRLLVYVGGFNPHKNLERLLAAFERVAERVDDVHLVLVGEVEEGPARDVYRHLRESITRRALADRVTFAGFLSDAELAALYSCAYAAVLPSLMEGLGLPAIEAAACGLPVIATRESPLRSLLGDGCLEIDPASVDSIAAAMTRLLGDSELRALAAEAALRGTRSLTWRRAAEQFLDLLVAG